MNESQPVSGIKKLVFVIIAGILAVHAATLFWGLMTHWTKVNLVFLDLIVGITVGLFVRMAATSPKPKYAIVAVLISLWGSFLGYMFNTIIFAADYMHHGYWYTFKVIGFSHTLDIMVHQISILDVIFIVASAVCAAVLAVVKKTSK